MAVTSPTAECFIPFTCNVFLDYFFSCGCDGFQVKGFCRDYLVIMYSCLRVVVITFVLISSAVRSNLVQLQFNIFLC